MSYFLKANKNLLTFSLVILSIIPIFGFKLLLSFIGNILILLFLIPLLLIILVLIAFNSYKSKINTCGNCGVIVLGLNDTCMNCGADLEHISKINQFNKKPSESTIEVKAEEIK
tara:strand:+ start:466 stop:807 length:342 start_codon:yes stop_codon:yes gene_type:complete